MNIPGHVPDGFVAGAIIIGDFQFDIDVSVLQHFIACAKLEMRRAQMPQRMDLLVCMEEAAYMVMENSVRPTEAEAEINRQRWEKTGDGGYQNLEQAWKAIAEGGGHVPRYVQARMEETC